MVIIRGRYLFKRFCTNDVWKFGNGIDIYNVLKYAFANRLNLAESVISYRFEFRKIRRQNSWYI